MSDPGIGSVETHGVPASAVVPDVVSGAAPAAEEAAVQDQAAGGDTAADQAAGEGDSPADQAAGHEPTAGTGPPRPPFVGFRSAGSPVPPRDAYSLRLVATRTLWDAGTLVAALAPSGRSVPPTDAFGSIPTISTGSG